MWTNLILAWLGLNMVLVLLLWRRSILLSRREEQRIATQRSLAEVPGLILSPVQRVSTDAEAANAGRRSDNKSRVVVVSGDRKESPRLPSHASPAACNGLIGFNATRSCRFTEMQAEIRELRLVVAELSLERARLSSAIARRRC